MSDPLPQDPTSLLHWEDFPVGGVRTFGAMPVSRDDIVAFATEFDPQPFHLDEAAAAESLLGGLAASGWHTCAMMTRMMCDDYLLRAASMGSPGVDEVRWLKPVRPGDILSVRQTCLEARISRSRPELGLCKFHYEVLNQTGARLMTCLMTQFLGRRQAVRDAGDRDARPETQEP